MYLIQGKADIKKQILKKIMKISRHFEFSKWRKGHKPHICDKCIFFIYFETLFKQDQKLMVHLRATISHCYKVSYQYLDPFKLEKGFQKKPIVAFTNSTVFILDFNI